MRILQVITDTLSQKPEIGIFSSMAGVALSPIAIISLISAVLGLVVTIFTLIINVMTIREKVRHKQQHRNGDSEDVFIDNQRYRRVEDEDDAE